jgi:hypothetical protein
MLASTRSIPGLIPKDVRTELSGYVFSGDSGPAALMQTTATGYVPRKAGDRGR